MINDHETGLKVKLDTFLPSETAELLVLFIPASAIAIHQIYHSQVMLLTHSILMKNSPKIFTAIPI